MSTLVFRVEVGGLVRLAYSVSPGEETPWTFKTDSIQGGKRIGSLLALVDSVCASGCCSYLLPTDDEYDGSAVFVPIEFLRPLLEGDTDGTAHGEQHTPMGEGSDVQGLRRTHEREASRATLSDALPPPSQACEGKAQGVTYIGVDYVLGSVEARYAALLRAIYLRRGEHDHDGYRGGCFACTLIRELKLEEPT